MIVRVPGGIAPPQHPAAHRAIDRHPSWRPIVPIGHQPTRHRATPNTEHVNRAARLVPTQACRREPETPWLRRVHRRLLGPNWA